jgi:hypothetical protein
VVVGDVEDGCGCGRLLLRRSSFDDNVVVGDSYL